MYGNPALLAMACIFTVAVAQAQAVYEGSPMEGRFKRQAGPPRKWMELRACCATPMVIKQEFRAACFPAPGGTPPATPVAGGVKNCGNHTCAVQCAYKAQGLLNAAGTGVDSAKLTARIAELAAADSRWTTALNAATATCITPGLPSSSAPVCKSGASEVMTCINNQLYQKCPDGVRSVTAACTELLKNGIGKSG